jgi:hypothetical protein
VKVLTKTSDNVNILRNIFPILELGESRNEKYCFNSLSFYRLFVVFNTDGSKKKKKTTYINMGKSNYSRNIS